MAKKNLLAANLKRPSLKREMKVTEAKMDEVVRKVADNPPPAPKEEGRVAESVTAPPTSPAPAAAPANKPAKEPVRQARREKGRPRKETTTTTPSSRSVHPREGTKRLTLDIPQELHKKLKLLAIHQEISMKDYIIAVVERSL